MDGRSTCRSEMSTPDSSLRKWVPDFIALLHVTSLHSRLYLNRTPPLTREQPAHWPNDLIQIKALAAIAVK